jgi:hypothetical protein
VCRHASPRNLYWLSAFLFLINLQWKGFKQHLASCGRRPYRNEHVDRLTVNLTSMPCLRHYSLPAEQNPYYNDIASDGNVDVSELYSLLLVKPARPPEGLVDTLMTRQLANTNLLVLQSQAVPTNIDIPSSPHRFVS